MEAEEKASLRFVAGTLWMVAMRWSVRLAGFVSTLILARVLAPEDFGIIAMAKMAMGLLEALSSTGTQLALIRTPEKSRSLYDTAWTVTLIQRVFTALILFLIAPLAVDYFNEPRTLAVIQVLAIATLLRGFINIGIVDFRKDLNFRAEFQIGVLEKLAGVVIAISLAITLKNYWALTFAIAAESLVGVILSYLLHPYRPRLNLSRWNDLWRFSMWILVMRLAFFGNNKIDQILIGGAFDATSLGYYNFGSELGTLPGEEIAEPLRRSTYPNLSKLSDSRPAFAKTFLSVFSSTAFVLLPIGFGLAAAAPFFVTSVLGEKWIPAIPILAISAIYGVFSSMSGILEIPLLIVGKEKLAAMVAWAQLILLFSAVYFATSLGSLTYIALARAVICLFGLVIIASVVATSLKFSISALVSATWRSVAASVAMYTLISVTSNRLDVADLLILIISVGIGLISYPVFALILWLISGRPDGPESYILNWLIEQKRLRAKANL